MGEDDLILFASESQVFRVVRYQVTELSFVVLVRLRVYDLKSFVEREDEEVSHVWP